MIDAIHDDDGKLIGFAKITRDLTERREAQMQLEQSREQLFQAQKMEAIGQLTGGLAHDFNNLLTGITGSLELLRTRLAQGRIGDLERYIAAAQGAASRAAALTHRLLAFARRQTLDPKPIDANKLIAGMEELVRRTVGPAIEVETVLAIGLWPTLCDPNQLENALLNLCINARDAMPDGGRLTIETANIWLDERGARERDMQPGQYVAICVTDTGTGMPPEVLARAFDPFFTTKPIGQGTGLGLSMIYGFARQSGGQVRIYSEVGAGHDGADLLAPASRRGGRRAARRPSWPRRRGRKRARRCWSSTTSRACACWSPRCWRSWATRRSKRRTASSGLKVLQSDVRIDLLITDVGLPGGMNGRQMADAARRIRPNLKVLFITGYAENAAIGNGHLEPGMHVLTKPFAMEMLASRIRAIIGES